MLNLINFGLLHASVTEYCTTNAGVDINGSAADVVSDCTVTEAANSGHTSSR